MARKMLKRLLAPVVLEVIREDVFTHRRCNSKMDSCIRQKETASVDLLRSGEITHEPQSTEICDKSHYQQHQQSVQYQKAIAQLNQIFGAQQSGSKGFEGDLAISSDYVEIQLAKYIGGCLHGAAVQSRNIDDILTLVKDYKVVQYDMGQTPSVSLEKIYLILQDNYKDSFFCQFFNVVMGNVFYA